MEKSENFLIECHQERATEKNYKGLSLNSFLNIIFFCLIMWKKNVYEYGYITYQSCAQWQ